MLIYLHMIVSSTLLYLTYNKSDSKSKIKYDYDNEQNEFAISTRRTGIVGILTKLYVRRLSTFHR